MEVIEHEGQKDDEAEGPRREGQVGKRARRKLPPPPPTTWEPSQLFPLRAPRPKHINHFGISGGKDSTALLLWALFESGYPRESLDITFCDTGNESPITYRYVAYLEAFLQIGITRIHPGLKFFELAARKRRFPSAKARFCTYALKIKPTIDYINATFREGHTMTLHSGVRAAESDTRAKLLDREYDGNFLCEVVRPLLRLSVSDVWAMHEKYGIRPNPLYAMGMLRVGCFPCVMSRKSEIKNIAAKFPEAIDHIRERERISGRPAANGFSSFYGPNAIPARFHSRVYRRAKDGKEFSVATIDDVVRWSKTGKGAIEDNTMDLFAFDEAPAEKVSGCQSGFCE